MTTTDKELDFSRPLYWLRGWCGFILVVIIVVGFPSTGSAKRSREIGPFRITGIDGYMSLRFLFEEDSRRQDTEEGESRQRRPVFEEEIYFLTHSYIYHPNLLKLDLGGGPVFAQETFESNDQQISSSDTFYNLTANLTFLEKKPYSLSLYYIRLNPRIPLGKAERFFLTSTRYGFKFRVPFGPIPLKFEGYRQTQKGKGFDQVTDESSDHLTVQANKFSLWQGDASLLYQFNRRDSASGNPQIPIERTRTTTHSADFNTNQFFGSRDQVQFQNFFSFFKRFEFPKQQDIRVNPNLQWDLTDSLTWFSHYNLRASRVEGMNITSQAASTGLNHRLYQSLFTELDVHADKSRTTGLSTYTYGGKGDILYRKKIPFGNLSLHYNTVYDIKDNRSTAFEITVFGEIHVLSGLFPVELRHDNVIASTIVVSNATRTSTFTEGMDYRLIVVGGKTKIQRLPAGDIQDGEMVFVDYSFATTGTFKFSIFDQNYEASVHLFSYLTLRARFRKVPQRHISGTSTRSLNSIRSQLYSARFRVPIRNFLIEADGEYEDHQEKFSSFRRTSYSMSLQIPIFSSTTFTLSGRRVLVDHLKSVEDVDIRGGSIRLESRPWSRVQISTETIYEEDTGGTLKQRNWFGNLRAEWRIRQLILRAEGKYRWEQRPKIERENIKIKVEIRREF